ncbi:collagen alpha-1(II) chain-like [Bos indicus x Bos taurus]|uniref:collagen alpha-1(II) chain-like n=1 Tax=Bos indicus x Bos taurus TaxID=30522 RepID=UPI000F7D16D5|nr:collagen alpha-1(II) chain-like [Bos indicus x Bos taurus]
MAMGSGHAARGGKQAALPGRAHLSALFPKGRTDPAGAPRAGAQAAPRPEPGRWFQELGYTTPLRGLCCPLSALQAQPPSLPSGRRRFPRASLTRLQQPRLQTSFTEQSDPCHHPRSSEGPPGQPGRPRDPGGHPPGGPSRASGAWAPTGPRRSPARESQPGLGSLGAHGTQEITCPGVPAGPREPGHEPAASTTPASWGPTPHLHPELRPNPAQPGQGPRAQGVVLQSTGRASGPRLAQASLTRATQLPCRPSRATQTASPLP